MPSLKNRPRQISVFKKRAELFQKITIRSYFSWITIQHFVQKVMCREITMVMCREVIIINLAVLMFLTIMKLTVFESFFGKGFPMRSQVLRVQPYPVFL